MKASTFINTLYWTVWLIVVVVFIMGLQELAYSDSGDRSLLELAAIMLVMVTLYWSLPWSLILAISGLFGYRGWFMDHKALHLVNGMIILHVFIIPWFKRTFGNG
jgi:hypothetical protein